MGFCGLLLMTLIMGGYSYLNMQNVVRTDFTVTTGKQAADYDIVLITDTHFDTLQPKELVRDKAEEISALYPDLVILGGDIVEEGTSKESMEEVFGIFGGIRTKYGVYYVYGNHDRQPYTSERAYTDDELEEAISGQGIRILQDESVEIAGDLTLAGRDDAAWGNTSDRINASELLSGADPETFIIVADHQPIDFEACAAAGADLEVSGHTHAGQTIAGGLLNQMAGILNYGLYHEDGIDVIVSSGFAGWGLPLRSQGRSEYAVIHIRHEEETPRER